MKHIASFLLACVVLWIGVCGTVGAFAAEDVARTQIQSSETYYTYDAATATLTIDGSGAIPNFTNSTGASTSQPWATYRSEILHVVVAEGITSLGAYCFYNVSKADIALPSTLISLGAYSMSGTHANAQVVLPQGLTTISANAFRNTSGLQSISIPESVTSIGTSAFESCTGLQSVTFAHFNMQVSIGSKAFLKCSALKTMTVPKRAALANYSIGYSAASAGSVYADFVMRVYRDSAAYTYAISKVVACEIIGSSVLREGDCIDCTYYTDSITSAMRFVFTPNISARYLFFSSGETDVRCALTDANGTVLAESEDVSVFDTNFKMLCDLTAGESYSFDVFSNNAVGAFAVCLMPYTVSQVQIDTETIVFSAAERVNGVFDVAQQLEGKPVTVTYDTGFTDVFAFESGMTYYEYQPAYSDTQSETRWSCGSQVGTFTLGAATQRIAVEIEHSYTSTVVAPTYTQKGYTRYTCSLCGDTYDTAYVNSIGVRLSGNVVLMQAPDGSHKDNIPIANVKLYADGIYICTTEQDGGFLAYVDADVQTISIEDDYGLTKKIALTPDDNNEMNLGEIAFFHFDYNGDGYVNAKDYAELCAVYGKYPNVEKNLYLSRDYNQDGILDDRDWLGLGVENFFAYGKITEEIY